jgi:hypothetical protein
VTFSERLIAVMPPRSAPEADYPPAFGAMADQLLNHATLRVAGRAHRFTEVEFYVDGLGHRDTFTHGDELQKRAGSWYFHRTAGRYRGGTYKGLDLAIGHAELFGGILIRGIEQLEPQPRLVDGPCLCVDHILSLTGSAGIEQLVGQIDGRADRPASGESLLCIDEGAGARKQPVLGTARVGLTLKRSASAERQRFLARSYRFLTEPRAIKKGKVQMVVALHRGGSGTPDIVAATGVPKASVERYTAAFEAGRQEAAGAYRDDLSSERLCELLGACDRWLAEG